MPHREPSFRPTFKEALGIVKAPMDVDPDLARKHRDDTLGVWGSEPPLVFRQVDFGYHCTTGNPLINICYA